MNLPKNYHSTESFLPAPLEEVKLIIRCNTWPEGQGQTTTGHLELNGKWFIKGYEGECYQVLGWSKISNPNGQSTETI